MNQLNVLLRTPFRRKDWDAGRRRASDVRPEKFALNSKKGKKARQTLGSRTRLAETKL